MSETPKSENASETLPEPANLRFLRLLVTVLTAVMIAGLLAILAMIVISYRSARAPLPEVITLPDGAEASAFTQGADWYAVVTEGNEILIFDRASGKLRQTLRIESAE
ncbi:DUF6476 family protein [Salipiger thiooxidans]|jgi:hypothetical protein|uniref:DUF6476 family protein n=1 Tax=Salipiger thiooxidans TaxID=282683 RepID=UPI0001B8B952|nr:DUF6476 family protein [Salipiger thiooxidans]EEX16815.1 conserved hypothetical protein [Citreicella sp. SE45]MAU44289.1 hypothetical protein [Salipiger sp.]MBR9838731.1 hypothetical protein [Paracoccaceae bacterium]MBN8187545.1 hypothetical protein [Salipiger thiooxidans]MCA0849034.1 DUF6476 family protein [Salipiger thiooxidans]